MLQHRTVATQELLRASSSEVGAAAETLMYYIEFMHSAAVFVLFPARMLRGPPSSRNQHVAGGSPDGV